MLKSFSSHLLCENISYLYKNQLKQLPLKKINEINMKNRKNKNGKNKKRMKIIFLAEKP